MDEENQKGCCGQCQDGPCVQDEPGAQAPASRAGHFCGEITSESVGFLLDNILSIHSENPGVPIALFLTSGGGDPTAGMHFAKMIQIFGVNLRTIAVDLVGSAALFIFFAAKERGAHSDARFLFHNLAANLAGGYSAQEVLDLASHLARMQESMFGLLAKLTGKTPEEIMALCDKNQVIGVEDMVRLGLLHGIIEITP